MSKLETLKKEAREELSPDEYGNYYISAGLLDAIIQNVVEAVEESVVPEIKLPKAYGYAQEECSNDCNNKLIEAFANFKK